ncbi:hypothetical protein F0562_015781 [Nyssa sinensis]|uniref:DUF7705 domain-containing protein n=1 Tax=Nyssa sinensis TaxID=561372 RepID=A0A5J4ZL30_9ASTE|nr:hypothetical protein F0562_015781 [Nyssa sinensis]
MRGSFNGTYELGSDISDGINGISYFEVIWGKKVGVGSWVFSHKLKTSKLYPWLMLYLRADATKGFSGNTTMTLEECSKLLRISAFDFPTRRPSDVTVFPTKINSEDCLL